MATNEGSIGPVTKRAGLRIRLLRVALGLPLAGVSVRLEDAGWPIPMSTLSRIENGTGRLDVDGLVALAKVLEVEPAVLLDEEWNEPEWVATAAARVAPPALRLAQEVARQMEPLRRQMEDVQRMFATLAAGRETLDAIHARLERHGYDMSDNGDGLERLIERFGGDVALSEVADRLDEEEPHRRIDSTTLEIARRIRERRAQAESGE